MVLDVDYMEMNLMLTSLTDALSSGGAGAGVSSLSLPVCLSLLFSPAGSVRSESLAGAVGKLRSHFW